MRTLTKPLERVAEEFAAVRRELAQVAGDGGVRSRVALLEGGQRARVVRERAMESAESSRSLHGWDLPGRNLDVLPQRQGEPIVLMRARRWSGRGRDDGASARRDMSRDGHLPRLRFAIVASY